MFAPVPVRTAVVPVSGWVLRRDAKSETPSAVFANRRRHGDRPATEQAFVRFGHDGPSRAHLRVIPDRRNRSDSCPDDRATAFGSKGILPLRPTVRCGIAKRRRATGADAASPIPPARRAWNRRHVARVKTGGRSSDGGSRLVSNRCGRTSVDGFAATDAPREGDRNKHEAAATTTCVLATKPGGLHAHILPVYDFKEAVTNGRTTRFAGAARMSTPSPGCDQPIPLACVTPDCIFSIIIGPAASTVTPGSTPPEVSIDSPCDRHLRVRDPRNQHGSIARTSIFRRPTGDLVRDAKTRGTRHQQRRSASAVSSAFSSPNQFRQFVQSPSFPLAQGRHPARWTIGQIRFA